MVVLLLWIRGEPEEHAAVKSVYGGILRWIRGG
jgi:hypothetical protein